jgi:hypothetical protein
MVEFVPVIDAKMKRLAISSSSVATLFVFGTWSKIGLDSLTLTPTLGPATTMRALVDHHRLCS